MKIEQALEELRKAFEEECPDDTVGIDIFMNCYETTINYRYKTKECLKREGISMKNSQGRYWLLNIPVIGFHVWRIFPKN